MFGSKKEPQKSFWNLHADIQSFVSTIDEAVTRGRSEVAALDQTIKEAEGQKQAISDGMNWLGQVRKVFPEAKI